MNQFASRNTPVVGAPGFESTALPATTELLSALVAVPNEANAATLQGEGNASFGYRLDGAEGEAAADTLTANQVYLSNREEIAACCVVANGGATNLVVQWYTGRAGQ